ncbi:MAG: F0F1 ATP synthase subunit A [bacterium]|nr:F0F1 ATP synthase subunit A [bacterium]
MSNKKKVFLVIGIIFTVEFIISLFGEYDMSQIAAPFAKIHTVFGVKIPFNGINISTVLNTWLIMAVVIAGSYFFTRRLTPIPGRLQAIAETYVSAFDTLCTEVLGKKRGRKFLPFVATLFIFVLLSNWVGVIPSFWHVVDGVFPHWLAIEEPTRDLNTTLGFGIMCFFVAHISGIYVRGFKGYVAEYFVTMPYDKGFNGGNIGKFIFNMFMGLLNIVGEIGKTISHSFRLFGNILGGAIIMVVICNLIRFIVLPVFLNGFFGLFVGAVQAFVFTMLALVYVSVMVNE